MVNRPLDLKLSFKRKRSLESDRYTLKTLDESTAEYNLNVQNKNIQKKLIESDLKNMDWNGYLYYLEGLYEENNYDLLESCITKFTNFIIPTIDNLPNFISRVNESCIGDINKTKIMEVAKNYKSIDRICKNHDKLSKRFPIYEVFCNKSKSNSDRINSICKFIDTYDISPYIKFNIALEEISYLNYYNSSIGKIDEADIVEDVLNYFLFRENNTASNINEYRNAILESNILHNNADKKVEYFTNKPASILEGYIPDNFENDFIGWKLTPNKTIEGLVEIANKYNNTSENVFLLLSAIREFCIINDKDFPSKVYKIPFVEHNYNFGEVKSIYSGLKEYTDIYEKDKDIFKEVFTECNIFKAALEDSIYESELLKEDNDKFEYDKTDELYTKKEVGKLKLNNLISDIKVISELLTKNKKTLEENGMDTGSIPLYPITYDNFVIENYIDGSEHINIPLYNIKISRNAISENVINTMRSIQKCANNILYNSNTYFEAFISDNDISTNLISKYKVALTLEEENSASFPDSIMQPITDMITSTDKLDSLDINDTVECLEKLDDRKFAGDITSEQFNLINDIALSIYGNNDILEQLVENAKNESNDDYDKIKETYTFVNFNEASVDYQDIPEAVKMLTEAINIDAKGALDATGKALNNLRLAWQVFKNKAKKAAVKTKEVSRDIDITFNNFAKSIQSAFKSNTREQIIRGQVTPSLSKMLAIGIGLAGTGLLSGGIYIPAVIAACGLVLKRKATTKEVGFIIDELDIELKVLDREVSKAESEGSTRKYRELLKTQKRIQRERQKILYKYALKGKKFSPVTNANNND